MLFTAEFQTKELTRAVAAVLADLARPEHLLGNIGEALLRVNSRRHEQGLAPDGTPWHPLSAATVAAKKKHKNRILYGEGDMLGSFHYQADVNALTLAFTDRKAIWHHDGTKPYDIRPKVAKALKFGGLIRKRVHHPGLPARPLVGFSDSDAQLTGDVTVDHFDAILNGVS